ncbi:MAG: GGDEF domain-containing phosphodiesterase [Pseudomonadota bacterium]
MDHGSTTQGKALTRRELSGLLEEQFPGRSHLGLLLIYLDGFDHANATQGFEAGEQLFNIALERLYRQFRSGDLVLPAGHGQIAVLIANISRPDEARRAADKALRDLKNLRLPNRALRTRPRAGIAVWPSHGNSAQAVLQAADLALYQTTRGLASVQMLPPGLEAPANPLALAAALESALNRNELTLVYQPQVSVDSGRTIGVEALSRWRLNGIPVAPADFVPIAEQSGLMKDLTAWSLKTALDSWRSFHPVQPGLRMSVNLSASLLEDPELVPLVRSTLSASQVPPENLVLELTEGALMGDPERRLKTLKSLKSVGVGLSVDDFGTGFSSLSYLSRFPLDELKVDRTFIGQVFDDVNGRIVRTALDLAHQLDLKVVAEGIEDEDTLDALRELNCQTAQGYFIAEPMAADDVVGFLDRAG